MDLLIDGWVGIDERQKAAELGWLETINDGDDWLNPRWGIVFERGDQLAWFCSRGWVCAVAVITGNRRRFSEHRYFDSFSLLLENTNGC